MILHHFVSYLSNDPCTILLATNVWHTTCKTIPNRYE